MKSDVKMKFFKKIDILIIGLILLISLVFWGGGLIYTSDSPVVAEIYYKSKLVKTVDLSKEDDKIFSISQNPNVVFHLYEDGSIRFESSDCKDKICIRTGRLRLVGQSSACLPNQIIVKIVRKNKNAPDDLDMVIG